MLTLTLDSGLTLSLGLSYTIPGIGPGTRQATFHQDAYAAISSQEARPLSEFLALAYKLQNLISLACDQVVNIVTIQGQTPEVEREGRQIPIDIYIDSLEHSSRTDRISWHRMFFTYPDLVRTGKACSTRGYITTMTQNLYSISTSLCHRMRTAISKGNSSLLRRQLRDCTGASSHMNRRCLVRSLSN